MTEIGSSKYSIDCEFAIAVTVKLICNVISREQAMVVCFKVGVFLKSFNSYPWFQRMQL